MSFTFRNVGVNSNESTSTCTIIKPIGLSVGDLMIAQILHRVATPTFTSPASWTSVQKNVQSTTLTQEIFWKYADAGDVAGTNFIWTSDLTGTFIGAIMAWSAGFKTSSPIGAQGGEGNGASLTPDFAAGLTPLSPNSLLLFLIGTDQETSSPDLYQIATSNPVWTEAHETPSIAGADATAAAAYAERPETTPTGAWSCTLAVSLASVIQGIIIEPGTAAVGPTPYPVARPFNIGRV